MAAPFIYVPSSDGGGGEAALFKAALDGDLGRFKGVLKSLGIGHSDPAAVFSFSMDGFGVMHLAAGQGHLEVCKYLVEELRGDPNMIGGKGSFEGTTPFMMSAHSGDVCTVKYFLDHGGDPMKADAKGRSVLHYAVSRGSCKVTEFLLSKGIPVDIDCGYGTPLYHAATNEQDKTLKILLNHNANPNTGLSKIGNPLMSALLYRSLKCMKLLIKTGADVNGKGCVKSPLLFATSYGGYTEFVPVLLQAGADPNVPDDLGWLPVELAAFRGCREEVELLLPLTSPIPDVPNWSIDGLISHAKFKRTKPLDKGLVENRKTMLKSETNLAFRRKDYVLALKTYSLLLEDTPDATLYSNRSLCKLKMGDGEGALSDAYRCRMMRPDWAKACYRQAAAHIYSRYYVQEYKQACDALLDAKKLDPGNDEIERELRKAMELTKISPDEGEKS